MLVCLRSLGGRLWRGALLGAALLAFTPPAQAISYLCTPPPCPERRFDEGNSALTGIPPFDSYFSTVLDARAKVLGLVRILDSESAALARSLGLPGDASEDQIEAAIHAKLAEHVAGEAVLHVVSGSCTSSAAQARAAYHACEHNLQPDWSDCKGSCQLGHSPTTCGHPAVARCTGVTPELSCSGDCTGACELSEPGSCAGTCRGTCIGVCTRQDGLGQCAGPCEGECQGTCEVSAEPCSGRCLGTCTWLTQGIDCPAGAEIACELPSAISHYSLACEQPCDGTLVHRGAVGPHCREYIDARVALAVECEPWHVELRWQWAPDVADDPVAKAAFEAWSQGLEQHFAVGLWAQRRLSHIGDALGFLEGEGALRLGDPTFHGELEALDPYGSEANRILIECALPDIEISVEQIRETAELLADARVRSSHFITAL
ncbi:MAG: hypothetical protein HC927_10385 [Deltaproteobacteria bacterium]|nr:hypothetical protein [Deltaproteobacteria bacterium]